MQEDFVQALLADAGLAALVGRRITWAKRKQGAPLPAIVLHVIAAPTKYTLKGRVQLRDWLVQADCMAGGFLAAVELARAAQAAIATPPFFTEPLNGVFVVDERTGLLTADAPDPASGSEEIDTTQVDLRVWHRAAA
jgi:hypothetical protein